MKIVHFKITLLFTVMVLSGCSCGGGKSGAAPAQSGMPGINVTLTNSSGGSFVVGSEVATTDQEHETGLMNRTSLGENDGMLFVFSDEQIRYFWMKNTLISLDMIFIGTDREIVDINRNAVPESTVAFESAGPARYVLEVAGGYCSRHNINIGDTVSFEGY